MKSDKKVRIGVVGTGLIAYSHGTAIKQNGALCEVTALCDIVEGKAEGFRDKMDFDGAQVFTDFRTLMASGLCDMVSICTSNDVHRPALLCAAEHGLAVLCEKPVGLTEAEVTEMGAVADKAGVTNLAGFTYRHIPAILEIKKIIDSGQLGTIRHFSGRMYADRMANPQHPLEWRHLIEKAGSGVLGDLGSHVLDMAHFLLEGPCGKMTTVQSEMAIMVPARRDSQSGRDVAVTCDDVCNVWAHFESGAGVTVETSRHAPFDLQVFVSGDGGTVDYRMSQYDEYRLHLYQSPGDFFKTFKTVPVSVGTPLAPEPTDRMARQYRYFLSAMLAGEPVHPTITESVGIAHLLDVIQASAKTRQVMEV